MRTNTGARPDNLFPLRLSIYPREQIPRWLPAAISLGAVVLALIIGAVILALAGGNPLAAYAQIARSSFGGIDVFSDTLVKATPLILVGLACTLAFRMRLCLHDIPGRLAYHMASRRFSRPSNAGA